MINRNYERGVNNDEGGMMNDKPLAAEVALDGKELSWAVMQRV
jgi:hypothetical protein